MPLVRRPREGCEIGLLIFMVIEMEEIHGVREIVRAIISQSGYFPKTTRVTYGKLPRRS